MALSNKEKQANYRKRHPEVVKHNNEMAGRRRRIHKETVLFIYGNNKCACVICGENRLPCLSIDHINGGGNKQRKKELRSSGSFYRWLIVNRYPSGYQTLCMNCQFIKRFKNKEHN